jgi:inner membrane protein
LDPLTHTLVGASLSATRLGGTTRRAVPALVIGANLPDIDVFAYVAGDDAALGFRRGWTHGVLALIVLPALLALLLWAWERWRPGREQRTFSPRRLFALSYLAVLTHPTLDWLNTYGMRWLMPFDGTWFYGDSVFIMDPWLWLILGLGWLAGRRPGRGLLITFGVLSTLLVLLVLTRAPGYSFAVVPVLLALLLALLWRPAGPELARRVATIGLALAALFIGAMLVLHEAAEQRVRAEMRSLDGDTPARLMVGPMPLNPLAWEFVVSTGGRLRHGRLSFLDGAAPRFSQFDQADARESPEWQRIRASGQASGFVDWVRFPWSEPGSDFSSGPMRLFDARYVRRPTGGFATTTVELPPEGRP